MMPTGLRKMTSETRLISSVAPAWMVSRAYAVAPSLILNHSISEPRSEVMLSLIRRRELRCSMCLSPARSLRREGYSNRLVEIKSRLLQGGFFMKTTSGMSVFSLPPLEVWLDLERRLARIDRLVAEGLLDAEELIVLGDAVGSGCRAGFDLAGGESNHEVRDGHVLSLA